MAVPAANGSHGQAQAAKNGKSTRILGYTGLFLLAFFVFFIATFPYDILARGLLLNQVPPKLQPLQFDSLKLKLPLGLKATDVKLGKSQSGEPAYEADSLSISVGLSGIFKMISGTYDVSYKGDLYGGKISGTYDGTGKKGKVHLKAAGLKLAELTPLINLIKMNISGKLAGAMDLDWSSQWPENNGKLTLNITDGEAKNVNLTFMTVDFTFSKIEGELELVNGVLNVNYLVLDGTPSGFEIEGNIGINQQAPETSTLDLNIIFLPTPEMESSAPFSLLEKVGDGKYKAHLGGTFARPTFPQ